MKSQRDRNKKKVKKKKKSEKLKRERSLRFRGYKAHENPKCFPRKGEERVQYYEGMTGKYFII